VGKTNFTTFGPPGKILEISPSAGPDLNEREAPGKVLTARPPKRLAQLHSVSPLSFQLCTSTDQKPENWCDLPP